MKYYCNRYARFYFNNYSGPIKDDIIPVDSKKFNEVQLADVISGAIRANYENTISSDAKWELIHYIADRLNCHLGFNCNDLMFCTTRSSRIYNVWLWKSIKCS